MHAGCPLPLNAPLKFLHHYLTEINRHTFWTSVNSFRTWNINVCVQSIRRVVRTSFSVTTPSVFRGSGFVIVITTVVMAATKTTDTIVVSIHTY